MQGYRPHYYNSTITARCDNADTFVEEEGSSPHQWLFLSIIRCVLNASSVECGRDAVWHHRLVFSEYADSSSTLALQPCSTGTGGSRTVFSIEPYFAFSPISPQGHKLD